MIICYNSHGEWVRKSSRGWSWSEIKNIKWNWHRSCGQKWHSDFLGIGGILATRDLRLVFSSLISLCPLLYTAMQPNPRQDKHDANDNSSEDEDFYASMPPECRDLFESLDSVEIPCVATQKACI